MHRIIRWIVPALVGVTIIGTGYSVFSFANLNTTTSFSGENGPQISVSETADYGNLIVILGNLNNQSSNDDNKEESFVEVLNPSLVLSQRVFFNFNFFDIAYVNDDLSNNWDSDFVISAGILLKMTLGGEINSYIEATSWTLEENSSTTTTYIHSENVVFEYKNKVMVNSVDISAPVLGYKEDKAPVLSSDISSMKNTISGSSVSFSITLTLKP